MSRSPRSSSADARVVRAAAADRSSVARNAETSQNYDIAVAEYTKLLRDNPDNREARQGLERAKLRASQDHFTTARRLAATGKLEEALVEYQTRRRAQSRQRRHRARAAGHAHAAARQDRRSRRRQDAPRIADRAEPRGSAARRRSAGRCQASRLGGVPRRQRARRLLGDRQVHEPQRDVRSDVPRSAGVDRSARPVARRSAERAVADDAQFLARHRAAHHHGRARHRRQAPRVRRRDRPHVLLEQRRPQGNDRHAPHRRRCAPAVGDHRDQRDHDQGHARAHHRRRQDHHGDRQGAAGSDHRRRAARGESHAPAGVRPADRVAGLSRASAAPPTSTSRGGSR